MRNLRVHIIAALVVTLFTVHTFVPDLYAAPQANQLVFQTLPLAASDRPSDDLTDPDRLIDQPKIESTEYKISAFPNPNAGKFRLEISGPFVDSVDLVIINVSGKQVYKRKLVKNGELFLNLTPLRKGIYFAQIRQENKVVSHPIIYAYDE
jgi:hypothetical protein